MYNKSGLKALFNGFLLLSLVMCLFVFGVCERANAQPTELPGKNVLVINSYHKGYQWTDGQVTGISDAFAAEMPNVSLFVEYLDTKRFPNQDVWGQVFSLLLAKYPPGFLDLIITTDDNAYKTLLKHLDQVENVPIVFSGLNDFEPERIENNENITGIVEKFDFAGTYQLACELTGVKYKKIAFITDNTVTGRAEKADLASWVDSEPEIEAVWLDGSELSFMQLQEKLRELDEDTMVLLGVWLRGRGGTIYSAEVDYPKIEAAANRPVFGIGSLGLSHGIIGGSIIDANHHGHKTADLAIEILRGKSPSQLPVLIEPDGMKVLDGPLLEKYGLGKNVIDGWMVINKDENFYQRNRSVVIITAVVVLAELALIVLLIFNVVMRKRTTRRLQVANDTMRVLHEAMPDLIMVVDKDGNYLRIHEPGNKAVSIVSTRHIGANIKDVFDAESADALLQTVKFVVEKRCVSTIEYLRPDHKRWLEGHVAPLDDNIFGVPAVMWIARDIHNYKTAIAELDESRAQYKSVIEDSPASICVMSAAGEIQFVNTAYAHFFGLEKDSLKGVSIYDLIPDSQHSIARKRLASLTPLNPVGVNEHQVIAADGSVKWVRWTNRAFFDSNGKCETIQSFGEDFTDRILAEQQLRDNESNLRVTLNSIGDGVISTDRDGAIMQMNHVAERLTGIKISDAIGEDLALVFRIIDTNTGEDMENPVGKVLRTGTIQAMDADATLLSHDGNRYEISDSAAPIIDEGGHVIGVVLTFRDVTAENEKDRLLKESEKQKEIVLSHTGEIISYFDKDLNIVWTNRTPYDRGEIPAGVRCCEIMLGVNEPCCDGCLASEVMQSGQEGMKEMNLPDGKTYQILCTPVKIADSDEVVGVVAAARDITEQKNLRQQLIHSDRMSAIGRLAGGIAHDFNNLLQVMVGYGELLKESVNSDGNEALENIMDAAVKARNLVKQLLVFSRTDDDTVKAARPAVMLDNTASLLKPLIGEDINLKVETHCSGTYIQADAEKLQQVIMNICINARDAMGGKGQIVISADAVEFDESRAAKYGLKQGGKYVSFRICDNGPGIPEDVIEHIFEPFYTTKEVGSGSGLGLATAYAIVEKTGGNIIAGNLEDGGAMFEFFIPVSAAGVEQLDAQSDSVSLAVDASGKKVLLAEDDSMVRQYTTRLLNKMGFEVDAAENGRLAVEKFSTNPDSYSLVILDAIMPDMNGREAFDAIIEIRRDIAVLFATGYSSELLADDFIANKPDVILQKPFNASALTEAIAKVLV